MKPPPENRVVRLPGAEHDELKELLPWYVTGRLEPGEQARVEAHLAGCRQCRSDVAFQRRLGTEVASLPLEVEHGWAHMRKRIDDEALGPWRRFLRKLPARAGWVGAGAAVALAATAVVLPPATVAGYTALSAAPAQRTGDLVVIFRPDATERQVREALKASGARIVDGPTSADAYVLSAPAGRRDAALAGLRESGIVTLAEPLAVGADR